MRRRLVDVDIIAAVAAVAAAATKEEVVGIVFMCVVSVSTTPNTMTLPAAAFPRRICCC